MTTGQTITFDKAISPQDDGKVLAVAHGATDEFCHFSLVENNIGSFLQNSVLVGGVNNQVDSIDTPPDVGLYYLTGLKDERPSWNLLPVIKLSSSQIDGILPVQNGGTGVSEFKSNRIFVGDGLLGFKEVDPGGNGDVLTSQASGGPPVFQPLPGGNASNAQPYLLHSPIVSAGLPNSVNLGELSTGLLKIETTNSQQGTFKIGSAGADFYGPSQLIAVPVEKGGTGIQTLKKNSILVGNDISPVSIIDPGAEFTVLRSNGTTAAPSYGQVNLEKSVTGKLPVANGGTGASMFTASSLLYSSSASATDFIAAGATGTVLCGGGASVKPSFAKVDLAASVSGVLPVASGGTGLGTISANRIVAGSSVGSLQSIDPGTSGLPLVSNGSTGVASFKAVDISSGSSGTLSVARGGTGITSLTAYLLVCGSSSGSFSSIANGSVGQVLMANASGSPTFQTLTYPTPAINLAADNVTGTLPTSKGGIGTNSATLLNLRGQALYLTSDAKSIFGYPGNSAGLILSTNKTQIDPLTPVLGYQSSYQSILDILNTSFPVASYSNGSIIAMSEGAWKIISPPPGASDNNYYLWYANKANSDSGKARNKGEVFWK